MTAERQELVNALFGSEVSKAISAVKALARFGDSHALSMLMNRLAGSPEALALSIIDELVELGDSRAVPALVSSIQAESETVRGEALYALIALSEQRGTQLPQDLLEKSDFDAPALTQIVYPADLEALSALHRHLGDTDPEVRIAAAYGLGAMGSQKAATPLRDLALNDDDDDVKTAATYALGQLVEWGGHPPLAFLREIVSSIESPEVMIAAMRTLCFYRAADHVDLFLKCLSHRNERLRQLGYIGLGQSGDRKSLPHLVRGLTDPSTHVQRLAARSIGALGAHEGVEAMLNSAADASAELRTAVAEACKNFRQNELLAPLSAGARNPVANLRKVTAYVAAKVGILDICLELTQDSDPIVRKQATLGLADLYSIAADKVLIAAIKALDDEAWQVRVAGVEALGRMHDERGIQPMQAHADDSNHVVKQAIRRTLSKF